MRKTFLLLFSLSFFSAFSYDYDFNVDGIFYKISSAKDRYVAVTTDGYYDSNYSGNIVIPKIVKYNNTEFTVVGISYGAFLESEITSITLPSSIKYIEKEAFGYCNKLESVYIDDLKAWCQIDYSKSNPGFSGSESPFHRNPTYYAKKLYLNNQLLTSINSLDDIQEIYPYAFCNCDYITSLSIKDNKITKIGESAFWGCKSLSEVVLSNTVQEVGSNCFENCEKLNKVTLSSSLGSLSERVFAGCLELQSIILPDDIRSIKKEAFYGCKSLSRINLGNSVSEIEDSVFVDCALKELFIPQSVVKIGSGSFNRCYELESIIFEDSSQDIYLSAMDNTTEYRSEDNTVPKKGYVHGLFYDSPLVNIYIGRNITYPSYELTLWNGNHYKYTNGYSPFAFIETLKNVEIGEKCTIIEQYLFSGCSNISSINLGKNIIDVGRYALYGCSSLINVEFSSATTKIGYQSLGDCDSLLTIVCNAQTPPAIVSNGYEKSLGMTDLQYALVNLRVPKESIEKYKNTDIWGNFASIEESGNNTNGDENNTIPQCKKPIISYLNGNLSFRSDTEGSKFIYSIKDDDIHFAETTSGVDLSVTYYISVYAVAEGYRQSETSAATLCWLESEPKTEGINGLEKLATSPVLISSNSNGLNITGVENATHIEFYNLSGSYLGAEQVINGEASFETNENFVIVKIGEKSIKVKK